MWKQPTYQEYDCSLLESSILARAYSVGQAMSVGDLVSKGIGASGPIRMPDGTVQQAYVALKNDVHQFCELIVNGAKWIYNWATGFFGR